MRLALLGYGSIGARHAVNAQTLGHGVVVIDAVETARKRASRARFPAYERLSTACGPVQAAIIATPAPTHLELLRECIAWGLPTLVEKPLGLVADLPALRALRPTAPVMVGYQLRFHPEIQRIRPRLSSAVAGLLDCECDARTWPGSAGQQAEWIGEFSHEIDLALHCGAKSDLRVVHQSEHALIVQLGSFTVTLNRQASTYRRNWQFYDEPHGSYDIRFAKPEDLGEEMYREELAHFLRAVEGGPIAPGCTLEEGITVLDILERTKQMAGCAVH